MVPSVGAESPGVFLKSADSMSPYLPQICLLAPQISIHLSPKESPHPHFFIVSSPPPPARMLLFAPTSLGRIEY